ncbi:hypothetical protein B0H14DRAFT_3543522 [Mycena olivaceomarginata]|nr:hypothetical protein B0H14DRAFT_3543522 [Mycena olivaceomarginata]
MHDTVCCDGVLGDSSRRPVAVKWQWSVVGKPVMKGKGTEASDDGNQRFNYTSTSQAPPQAKPSKPVQPISNSAKRGKPFWQARRLSLIQADPLEPENSQVSNEVSMSEPNLDVDGKQDGEMISKGDLDVAGPRAVSVTTFAPSPVAPPQSEPREPQLSTRRSSRKRGASKTHEDAPVPKSKKAEVAAAPEPSGSGKRRTTRKPKAWSVRHTDDQIYTSFEFLAQFPDEYRTLYGDAEPA